MAEACEGQAVNPPSKRKRILNSKVITPVPVYSNKVDSSLQLRPVASVISNIRETDDGTDDDLWSEFLSKGTSAAVITVSDSEEDEANCVENKRQRREIETITCPSPSPPSTPIQRQSRKVEKKLMEFDKNLNAVNSRLSPVLKNKMSSSHTQGASLMLEEDQEDEDVIIVAPGSGSGALPYSSLVREIPLKVRCRADIHKIPVLSSKPLSDVVTKLSVILNVPPSRLMLLREELELPTQSTVSELGLGIADIIECIIVAAEEADEGSNITVKLQGKDRDSSQEFSLHKDAPLGSIFSRYVSKMPVKVQRKVRFHFDGSKVTHSQTPAQLSMEDGDIIEVWT